jgi:hypothetical protein
MDGSLEEGGTASFIVEIGRKLWRTRQVGKSGETRAGQDGQTVPIVPIAGMKAVVFIALLLANDSRISDWSD